MLRWLIVPMLVGISMPILTLLGWFQNLWVLLLFAFVSIASLLIWRRATARFLPSNYALKDADELTQELVGNKVQLIFAISIVTSIVAGVFLFGALLLEYNMPSSILFLVGGYLIWSSIVQGGACNLVCNYYLSRKSTVFKAK